MVLFTGMMSLVLDGSCLVHWPAHTSNLHSVHEILCVQMIHNAVYKMFLHCNSSVYLTHIIYLVCLWFTPHSTVILKNQRMNDLMNRCKKTHLCLCVCVCVCVCVYVCDPIEEFHI